MVYCKGLRYMSLTVPYLQYDIWYYVNSNCDQQFNSNKLNHKNENNWVLRKFMRRIYIIYSGLSSKQLVMEAAMSPEIILSNTYHLALQPGLTRTIGTTALYYFLAFHTWFILSYEKRLFLRSFYLPLSSSLHSLSYPFVTICFVVLNFRFTSTLTSLYFCPSNTHK